MSGSSLTSTLSSQADTTWLLKRGLCDVSDLLLMLQAGTTDFKLFCEEVYRGLHPGCFLKQLANRVPVGVAQIPLIYCQLMNFPEGNLEVESPRTP